MASLSDQIDRLSRNTKAIRSTATQIASFQRKLRTTSFGVAGPFTCAVLNTDLGDLIRDIDPSELGLFTLLALPGSHSRDNGTHGARPIEISRAEFSGATPLRKAPARRDDAPKPKEIEPEIYAQAALKYIDRYQQIRSMPRAHSQITAVMERLKVVRQSIQSWSNILEQAPAVEHSTHQPEEEERRVQELHIRLAELKRRKHAATGQQNTPHRWKSVIREEPNKSSSPPMPHEDKIWNTPATAARTLRFSDNLMEDNLDLNDITTASFMSPGTATLNKDFRHESTDHQFFLGDMTSRPDPDDCPPINDPPVTSGNDTEIDDEVQRLHATSDADEPDEDEKILIPLKPFPNPVPQLAPPLSINTVPESTDNLPETPRSKHFSVRISSEVERIVEKIWVVAGDLIMPGRLSEAGGHVNKARPPKAKEMIAHLQSLSALPLIPDTPEASSVSSMPSGPGLGIPPTSQQILTAYLLLTLLTSTPRFSMPLNQVKEVLASKVIGGPASAQGTTRIIYGCVAKRLVKIERGGGEQIVAFDV